MNAGDTLRLVTGLLWVWAAGCNPEPALRPVSPQAESVRVESFDPPVGARLAGPIQASDGEGCGVSGTRGSLANATTALKEAAARRGVGFVKLTRVTKPYSGHDCVHLAYELEGLAYYLAPATPPVVSAVTPLAAGVPSAVGASSAVGVPSAVGAPSAEPVGATLAAECAPPCSPGYTCNAGLCQALCNPACGPQQICRTDRVCVPAAQ
jgi:hypothetical protein